MRTGVMESATIPRLAPDLFFRNSKLIAAATGADSLWLPDHLNALLPASMWEPKYTAAARLAPRVDAIYEPWTALG